MKSLFKVFSLLFIPLFLLVGCKDDSEDPGPGPGDSEFEILSEYMMDNDLDLTNILDGWITAAPAEDAVSDFISSNYIIDIRSAADFAAGHIEGAANSPLSSVVDQAANAGGKPIIVVCYTGQTAGHAVVALRLSGYTNAKVLKFGMSSWHSSMDKWSANTGDVAIGHSNWTTSASPSPGTFEGPTFDTNASDGAGILAERVALLTSGGLRGVVNMDVLDGPTNYQINNFWAQEDVDHYGCIDGANRIKPLTLAGEEIFNLDPSETITTYCWTGQTSSMVTAYLYVLGYDAVSLKFGVNGMIYSDLESHKFTPPSVDLPVVTE